MKRIGLAGFGLIGEYLFEQLKGNNEIVVEAVWEPVVEKTASLDSGIQCKDLNDLGSRPLDLIVEAAHANVVVELWPCIKTRADLMISSMTSLSDPIFRGKVAHEAKQKGQKVFLPHGAVLGLDGLRDGRALLEKVSITTTKHPKNLGITSGQIKKPEVLFAGSTMDACKRFPRNVNVHAAVALAGIGFEKTHSVVIADPDTEKMHHLIEVKGQGLNWNLEIESFASGAVTGSYTPASLYNSLVSALTGHSGFCII